LAISVYQLKPAFQALLRPAVRFLFRIGITANMVTVFACLVSIAVGALVWFNTSRSIVFALIPVWMLLRMALNAIDGLLAKEFGQKTALGGILNEVTDVISDTALYLPFALVPGLGLAPILVICFGALLTEFVGVVAQNIGASRRYDGPMGKSDRAAVFGILGALLAAGVKFDSWGPWAMLIITALLIVTLINRTRNALIETNQPSNR
jgi:CDP-diacylglycerol---glycerol-3-phosphate 3-phosphatidyltransferase